MKQNPQNKRLAEAVAALAASIAEIIDERVREHALVRDPKRSFPSYISAATLLDMANTPLEFKDFFGVQTTTTNPAITRIRCPLLAFFGTSGDVGSAKELELLKSCIGRQSTGPCRVDTAMIQHHMYAGEEAQVAQTIAKWADTLLPRDSGGK